MHLHLSPREIFKNQEDLCLRMWCILVEWLIHVDVRIHRKHGKESQKFLQSLILILNYLENNPTPRSELQLVALSAFYVTTYIDEVRDLRSLCHDAYTRIEFDRMIMILLNFAGCKGVTEIHAIDDISRDLRRTISHKYIAWLFIGLYDHSEIEERIRNNTPLQFPEDFKYEKVANTIFELPDDFMILSLDRDSREIFNWCPPLKWKETRGDREYKLKFVDSRMVGSGTYGEVFKVSLSTSAEGDPDEVAVKIIERECSNYPHVEIMNDMSIVSTSSDTGYTEYLINEYLWNIIPQYVPRVYGYKSMLRSDMIATEFLKCRVLGEEDPPLFVTDDEIIQGLHALDQLHQTGVTHNDLSYKNVMFVPIDEHGGVTLRFSNGYVHTIEKKTHQIKFIDFGFAMKYTSPQIVPYKTILEFIPNEFNPAFDIFRLFSVYISDKKPPLIAKISKLFPGMKYHHHIHFEENLKVIQNFKHIDVAYVLNELGLKN